MYKFCSQNVSKPKKHGRVLGGVFLDVFSPPDHESEVHLPVKNLDQALATLLIYGVQHYMLIHSCDCTSMHMICTHKGCSVGQASSHYLHTPAV
jgi:hypothetical protein